MRMNQKIILYNYQLDRKQAKMKIWDIKYKGHIIRIDNGWRGEKLLVDGELQDEQIGFGIRSRLYGRIKSGDGKDELIKVSLGGYFSIGCIVFVDDREVFRSQAVEQITAPDKKAGAFWWVSSSVMCQISFKIKGIL